MARLKRKSTAVDFADNRANAVTSIDPALDLGNGLTLADYKPMPRPSRPRTSVNRPHENPNRPRRSRTREVIL